MKIKRINNKVVKKVLNNKPILCINNNFDSIYNKKNLYEISLINYNTTEFGMALGKVNKINDLNKKYDMKDLIIPDINEIINVAKEIAPKPIEKAPGRSGTIYEIALKYYKDASLGDLLAEYNLVNKYGIYNEEEIEIPIKSELMELSSINKYYSLEEISFMEYGSTDYIDILAKINGIKDYKNYYTKSSLIIPSYYEIMNYQKNNNYVVKTNCDNLLAISYKKYNTFYYSNLLGYINNIDDLHKLVKEDDLVIPKFNTLIKYDSLLGLVGIDEINNYYYVEKNDKLIDIVYKKYHSYDKLSKVMDLNNIKDPLEIIEGMLLKIKD